MSWSSITAKNCPAKPPTPTQPIKKVIQEEVKNDYWSDYYDCGWKTVETQIRENYLKLGLEVPKDIYGRPSPLDFGK